jgi:O-methyltransferase domain/Dimerisation domain
MTNTTMPPSPAAEVQAAAATMLRMIQGLHISRAVYVAAKLGISDLLADGPRPAAELAQLTKAHAPSLYRVLRLLAALNVLREQPSGHFALTPLGERLRTGVPGSLRYWALLTDQLGGLRPFDRIFDTVMSGEAGLKLAYDDKWTEFLANHPTATVEFQAAMSERTAAFAPSVAATYDFSQMRRVVDVGGGRGTLLAAVLAARAHLDGVVFDLPEVVAGAAETFRAAGVADRCGIESGDFFVAVPSGGHGYLLANVLHDWDDERSAVILRNCRRAMHADGKVLIVERMIFDDPERSLPTLLSDLNMLVLTGGQERTEEEYARLFVSAGLRLTSVVPVAYPYGIFEGAPN